MSLTDISFFHRTDRKLRAILTKASENVPTKKIAFDSFTDIKSEIGPLSIKSEPKWEMEVEVEDNTNKNIETIDGKDIVIANTVIRKVDPENEEEKFESIIDDKVDISWKSAKPVENDVDEDDVRIQNFINILINTKTLHFYCKTNVIVLD